MKLKFTLAVFLLFAGLAGVKAQKLWGVTSSGVADNKGVVFNTNPDGTGYAAKYSFNTDFPGSTPYNSLTRAPNAMLYGMTQAGGASDLGIIFEFDPSTGAYTKKFDFTGALGASPQGGFVLASNGLLYGMTTAGGATGDGILFSYSPGATTIVKKFDFNGTNGKWPTGSLMQAASNGFLYGVTTVGGSGDGVLFEYDPAGTTFVVKHTFSASTDGKGPAAELVEAANGKLYGLTPQGGSSGKGTLFEFNPAGPTFAKKLDFTGPNGSSPYGSLVANAAGTTLYGMTSGGGANNKGTIFSYAQGSTSVTTNIDLYAAGGYLPQGSMKLAGNGKYYGLTYNGGTKNVGVIFEYDGTTTYTKKFDFDPDISGANPFGGLTEAGGKLYGTATFFGPAGNGTLFEFNQATSTFTKKVDFSNASAGSNPQSGLTLASNGMLYGTAFGGANGNGVIYEINPSTSAYTRKFNFNASVDGSYPSGALARAANGKLYGTAPSGGANGDGMIFEYDPGTTSIVVRFSFNGPVSGSAPTGALFAASDGLLYGTTGTGGAGAGVLFSFNPSTGAVVNKYVFIGNGINGMKPQGGVIQAANGKLYGMTNQGGSFGGGALFEYNLAGDIFTKLFDMSGANGSFPNGELLQASNGKLYGLTSGGGANSAGVLFEYDYLPVTPTYNIKYNFAVATGSKPKGTLVEVASGVLFGFTAEGGSFSLGTVFKFDLTGNTHSVVANLDGNGTAPGASPQFGALLLEPAKQSQTITFGAIPNKAVGDVFALTATASPSGLAVSYVSSNPSVASIVGSTVTVHTPGTVTITASQGGNASYFFAQNVNQSLTISKATQTISFTLTTPVTYGSGTITLNGTASSSLPVSYVSSDPTVASITSNVLTILKAAPGGITITAKQAGDASYDPAPDVALPLVINKANQSISFAPPVTPQTYGNTFTITVSVTSGLPLSFLATPAIVSISGTGPGYNVTILGPSNQSTTIKASQAGNGNYNAAIDATGVVAINQASQAMTFGPLAAKNYGDAPFTLTGTSTSGLPLTYASSDPTVASISTGAPPYTVTILKAGSTQITPSQAGDANYLVAPGIGFQTLTVNKINQTITFAPLPVKSTSDPDFTLTATTNSSSPVTYGSSNTSVATVAGNLVHILAAGSTIITANAAADVNHLAATQVNQTLNVTVKLSQTITFNAIPSKQFGSGAFTLAATASSTLPVSYISSNPSIATISGNTVTIVGVGTSTITASQAGDATYNAAPSIDQNLVVTKGDQTITFQIISNPVVGSTFTLTGTATSGLPLSYQVITVGGASISGTTVTGLVAGSTTIRASQPGNANYNAASDIDASFCVRPVQPTITASGNVLTSSSTSDNFWALNGVFTGGTTQSITASKSGSYTVQVITVGCASNPSSPVVITGDIENTKTSFTVYPNPAKDRIVVDLHEFRPEPVEIKIIDQKGQSLHLQRVTGGDVVEIGLSEDASGLYILFVAQGDKIVRARYIKGQ